MRIVIGGDRLTLISSNALRFRALANSCSIYPRPRQADEIFKSREIREKSAFHKHTLEDAKTERELRGKKGMEEGLTHTFNDQWRNGHRYAYVEGYIEGNMRWKNSSDLDL